MDSEGIEKYGTGAHKTTHELLIVFTRNNLPLPAPSTTEDGELTMAKHCKSNALIPQGTVYGSAGVTMSTTGYCGPRDGQSCRRPRFGGQHRQEGRRDQSRIRYPKQRGSAQPRLSVARPYKSAARRFGITAVVSRVADALRVASRLDSRVHDIRG